MRTPSSFVRCAAFVCAAGLAGCTGDPEPGDSMTTEVGDGDGESGTGNGETVGDGDGEADTDTDCPLGTFDCPCDDGVCQEGLACGADNLCRLPGGDGDGDPTTSTTGDPTTTGDGDTTDSSGPEHPYDPAGCESPAEVLHVEGLEGEFCGAPCTEDADCPDGPSGTEAACAISISGVEPEYCTLMCTPGEEACPEGSVCEEIPQQPGFGLCTF